jgi:Flp pilus assembly protein TadG
MGNAGVYFQNRSNVMLEGIVIEDVWFNPSQTNNVTVTVRNTGSINVQLVALYLNSTPQASTSPSFGTTGISLLVGKAVSIKVTSTLTWSTVKVVYVSVATSRGTTVRGYWSTSN